MRSLEERLQYAFRDGALLENALTHSSYANEHRANGLSSNERLVFLGDSVLGVVVADYLFHNYPNMPEGELTRLRAGLVCEGNLLLVAQELQLGSFLKLGKGEELGGGRQRTSIQADAVEAVLAAVYLDGGIEPVRAIIQRLILDHIDRVQDAIRDHKTALQELIQRKSGQSLTYELIGEEGPDHAKRFRMEVRLNGKSVGCGEGRSKREAEQAAAADAYRKLIGK